jgi:hypothetical protein
VRAFCRKHGLSEASFYAWRSVIARRDRLASSGGGGGAAGGLIPVQVLADPPEAMVELRWPGGALRLPAALPDPRLLTLLRGMLAGGTGGGQEATA